MGAKLNKRQTESHRLGIKVGNLISLLDRNARGALKDPKGNPYELSSGKLKSIQLLLDKAMPNLSAIEQTHIEQPVSRQSLQEELTQLRNSLTPDEVQQLIGRMTDSSIQIAEETTGTLQ